MMNMGILMTWSLETLTHGSVGSVDWPSPEVENKRGKNERVMIRYVYFGGYSLYKREIHRKTDRPDP